jgi:cytoskeletal protein CcmA (bactofilin family)
MEYAAARNTMCRQCGRSYVPSTEKALAKPAAVPKPAVAQEAAVAAASEPSLLQRFEGMWGRQRSSVVECFDCKAKQEISAAASSTICPACSAHIDLRDYKITTVFSRNIKTHGEIHLTTKGDLSSNSVICRSAVIEGKLRGNLHCAGLAMINYVGKMPGRLTAKAVIVDRKADVQFFRQMKVGTIEIRGQMTGEVVAETTVEIHKSGSLDGSVTARSINVEKGGKFTGQLIIGQQPLYQAELLPQDAPPADAKPAWSPVMPPAIGARTLPAT